MYANQYLVKARHDDLMRAAAQARLAAQARRAHGPRRRHLVAAPILRFVFIRQRKATT
jgi:hypothetical protein